MTTAVTPSTPTGDAADTTAWRPTVFDTPEWNAAWSRSTIERIRSADEEQDPPVYLVEYSPFWHGYEVDTGLEGVWDRPFATVGTLYSFYGPAHMSTRPDAVADTVDRGRRLAAEWGSPGVLVVNLPADDADRWSAVRPPDAKLRLDIAYYRIVGSGKDPVVGDVNAHERTEWRRRWRRTGERGVRLVEEVRPGRDRIDEVVALTNGSAVKHGWPPVYDATTLEQVLDIPGARMIRADWDGRTVGGFVAFEHDRRLYLWAGGTDHTVFQEVSPYLFMLYELLRIGEERGWDRIEFGRGNDTFKRRYGFSGNELWSLWYASGPEDAERYVPKLQAVHEGLARCMGL